MGIWDRFEGIASAEEVKDAQAQFAPIDAGDYDMKLESIEPAESKKGLPMVKGKFRCVEGNKQVYYNQNLQNISNPDMTKVNIADAVTFLSGLIGEEIDFKSLPKLAELVANIPVGDIYRVNVSYGDKDVEHKFPKYRIIAKVGEVPFEV